MVRSDLHVYGGRLIFKKSLRCSRSSFTEAPNAFTRVLVARDMNRVPTLPVDYSLLRTGPRLPSMRAMDSFESEIKLFKRVHVKSTSAHIGSLEEARSVHDKDPDNAQALEYLGWWKLSHEGDYEGARRFLEESLRAGIILVVSSRQTF
jgi:hypothetical protein